MDIGLAGKVVIVTGAASGIGAAVAAAILAEGGQVCPTDREATGAGILADLADPDSAGRIVTTCIDRFGRVDGLVNAAGLTTRGSMLTGSAAIWDQLFAVNARAGFLLMQAVIADLTARGAAGAIVNILSMNAHCGIPELAIYSASKGAMATLTRNAAHAHMADRIRVNGINLGWVATPTEDRLQTALHGPDWQAQAAADLPLKRLVTAEEAARLAVFLLGDASIPMSGAVIDFEQKVAGAI